MARVAIIGGGVAGLTAGYRLSGKHDVILFEATGRIGGNAYTHRTRNGDEVDIAVAAFGKAGYKNFYSLLNELGVQTSMSADSYMSFHDLDTRSGIYLSASLKGLLSQGFGVFKPKNLASAVLMFKGLHTAQKLFDAGKLKGLTMEQALSQVRDFSGDTRTILLCALALLSSMAVPEILATPAEFFFGKLKTHDDILSPKAVYSVRCVSGGTKTYINLLAAPFRQNIVLNAKISTIRRSPTGVSVQMEDGNAHTFDRLVMACPADQALKLLAQPTPEEIRLLKPWRYKPGRVVVHRDYSAFPARDQMQAYTFLYTLRDGKLATSVNGSLWYEPQVSKSCEYISSQHPNFAIRPELIDLDTVLHTPLFDFDSVAVQRELPTLNGPNRTAYCGSYFGYGLHEDAVSSALQAAAVTDAALLIDRGPICVN